MATTEQHTHVVWRRIGDEHVRGEVVDASGWRWTPQLEEQHKLGPLPAGAEPVEAEAGRWFLDQEGLQKHGLKPAGEDTYPKHKGFGRWELSDGTQTKQMKREEAEKLEAALG